MSPHFIAVCTNGKVYDQALAMANVSKVYEVVPTGRTAQLLFTLSGTGSPYTITGAAVADASSNTVKVKK